MDIYNYINSRDVAAHCRKINKMWSPYEMAIIIQRSCCSMNERHSAFHTLMKEYPDMPIPKNYIRGEKIYNSFHKKLLESIKYEEMRLALFMKQEPGAIYFYEYYLKDDYKACQSDTIYSSYDKLKKGLKEDLKNPNISMVRIHKDFLDDDTSHITMDVNGEGDIFRIWHDCNERMHKKWYSKNPELEKAFELFDSRYIDIPVPFKYGDILIKPQGFTGEVYNEESLICVLYKLSDNLKTLDRLSSDDMSGWGFFADETGTLYGDHLFNYDEWEYYNGKLKGKDRILKHVNLFINGTTDLSDLLIMQSRIVTRRYANIQLSICPHATIDPEYLFGDDDINERGD